MKQQKTFSLVAFALLQAALLLSACSSEENIPASGGIAVTDAHINISVAPFETSSGKAKTRAEGTDETKADTVLLANGMRAICTVEEDDEAEQTRAPKPIADGHYTIYALDPVTGNRITGPDKLLKGTVTGGVFQSDGGTRLFLDPGTYKFVCINDAVEDNGTHLIINTGCHLGASPTYSPSAGDAQIGTATETISGDNWQVNFTMHHQNTRVRLHVIAYSDHMDDPWGFVAGVLNAAYGRQYNIDGTSPVVTMRVPGLNSYYLSTFKMPATSTNYNTTYVRAHDFYSDYMYLTPGVDIVAGNIAFATNSHLYGKQIPGNGYNKQIDALQNHSYTVTYRILPNALYLFQDGSCGALAEKGSRTPIGIVYSEKTNTQKGVAMGLQGTVQEWEATTSPTYNGNNYTTAFANTDDALQDENGYNWTWTSSTDVDGLVKANQQTRYPAFYWASHDPYGVGFGEWYFPGIGEIINVFDKLAKKTNVSGMYVTFGKKLDVITNAFVSAGGTDPMNYRCWSSTIYTQPGFSSPIVFYKSGSGGSGYNYTIEVRPQGAQKHNLGGIRTFPFVRF
ncbi:hypothetical protein SAMN02745202_02070 [Segatella oulorum]|uniref:Fimbrillin-like n=1 Tax=Segatella oulorum TaxID=28136 RepID=A0A1T4R2F9_9BACT|nr:hypothetical protein [Segatella oulorum]SKA10244.1 hypothetical protein SAMN02745202_02070 [Segatella oulorum]